MKYPRRNHFLMFKRQPDREWVLMKNYLTDEEWEVSYACARFLRALDGRTDPYKIEPWLREEDVEELLEYYEEQGWMHTGKSLTVAGIGTVLYTLWIPNVKKLHKAAARIWNFFLMVLCIPVFCLGISVFMQGHYKYVDWECGILVGYLIGFISGLVLHELSHAAACLAYGGHVFEFGIMLHYFMPGAYVAIDRDPIRNRFRKVQIFAAGIEMNLLLTGVFLLLLKTGCIDTFILMLAALTNFILVIFNLSFIEGLDGMEVYAELLGVDNLVEKARKLLKDRDAKQYLRSRGMNGKATIACCIIVAAFQILLPIILILNVISIAEVFLVTAGR